MENSKTLYYRYQGKVLLMLRKNVVKNIPSAVNDILEQIWCSIERFAEETAQNLIRQCVEHPEKFKSWTRRELNVRFETQEYQSKKTHKTGKTTGLFKKETDGGNSGNRGEGCGTQPKETSDAVPGFRMLITRESRNDSDCRVPVGQTSRSVTGSHAEPEDRLPAQQYKSNGGAKSDKEQPENEHSTGLCDSETTNKILQVTIRSSYGKIGNPHARVGSCRFLWDIAENRCIRIEK